jgi:hypothetical protein
MNLSFATSTTYDTDLPALSRRSAGGDPERSTRISSSSDNGSDESTTQRSAREPQETSRLTPEEQRQLSELQQRDREVKAHELAHKSVAGRYVTGGSFTYQSGPDGRRYAIGGEVTIDNSQGNTPEETLRKAELIRRAALAPADPSPQDYRVASQANLMIAEARTEIRTERQEEAIEARSTRQEQVEQVSENRTVTPRQGQRAIASFETIAGISQLQSNSDPIDELV